MSGADYVEEANVNIVSITINLAAVVVLGLQAASVEGRLYIGRPAAGDNPQGWTLLEEDEHLYAGSYSFAIAGTPPGAVYLLGMRGSDNAQIRRSADGVTWEVVYTSDQAGGLGITGLVWHPDNALFYACSLATQVTDDLLHTLTTVRILSSADGQSWGVVQEWSSTDLPAIFGPATEAFKALCTKPANQGGIPDGVQAYDAAKGIFIKPAGDVSWTILGPQIGGEGGGVVIEGGTGGGGGSGLPGGTVWAVSLAGGIWNALTGGPTSGEFEDFAFPVYASTDDGKNWEMTFTASGYHAFGMIGGSAAGP